MADSAVLSRLLVTSHSYCARYVELSLAQCKLMVFSKRNMGQCPLDLTYIILHVVIVYNTQSVHWSLPDIVIFGQIVVQKMLVMSSFVSSVCVLSTFFFI